MMRTYRAWSAAAAAGLLATAMGAAAFAADEPANIVKYRKAFMDANGAHITMIAAVVKGEVSLPATSPRTRRRWPSRASS